VILHDGDWSVTLSVYLQSGVKHVRYGRPSIRLWLDSDERRKATQHFGRPIPTSFPVNRLRFLLTPNQTWRIEQRLEKILDRYASRPKPREFELMKPGLDGTVPACIFDRHRSSDGERRFRLFHPRQRMDGRFGGLFLFASGFLGLASKHIRHLAKHADSPCVYAMYGIKNDDAWHCIGPISAPTLFREPVLDELARRAVQDALLR
jgi:hypothetical protein